jgi:hypothetical protein
MISSGRLSSETPLTLDEAGAMARVEAHEVRRAIDSKQLRATQERGEWVVLVGDLRRWLARR